MKGRGEGKLCNEKFIEKPITLEKLIKSAIQALVIVQFTSINKQKYSLDRFCSNFEARTAVNMIISTDCYTTKEVLPRMDYSRQ